MGETNPLHQDPADIFVADPRVRQLQIKLASVSAAAEVYGLLTEGRTSEANGVLLRMLEEASEACAKAIPSLPLAEQAAQQGALAELRQLADELRAEHAA